MYQITLISTRHAEIGECNSNALYEIIERINPEVIFEEIPPSCFDEYYVTKSRRNLETDAVSKYLESHPNVEHIPVDSDDIPPESFFEKHQHLHKRIENLTDSIGYSYRSDIDTCRMKIAIHGFKYLNSIYYVNVCNQISYAIEEGLRKINKDELFQTQQLWKDTNDKRENEMLKNIYAYSREHKYSRAIFTLGAAHRKSIVQKIHECEAIKGFKLNWIFYDE